jgi:hypothetical protein
MLNIYIVQWSKNVNGLLQVPKDIVTRVTGT